MADVLLVFVREDRVFGDGLRQSLETSGLNVVRCENEFDHNNPAPCILILWSAVSTRSGTLREIAAHAQRDGRLVTARLDNSEAPPGLTRIPPFDLSQWSGDPDDPAIDPVFFAVDRLVIAKARRRDGAPAALPQAPPATTAYSQPGAPRSDNPGAHPVTSNYAPIGRRQPDAAPVRAGPVGGRPVAPPPSAQAPPSLAEEALAWRSIEHSADPTDYLNFLQDFGAHGTFAELAQFKLDKLIKAGGKPAAGAFIQHKPSPHVEPPKHRQTPPAPRIVAPPPEMREAPEPPWREPAPRERIAAAELEPSTRSRRSVSGRPRRRVAEAALEAPMRHEQRSGGAPWAPMLFVLLLVGGGFAYLQMQPKKAETAEATQPEAALDSERAPPSPQAEPGGNRTTLAAAYERAGPLASAPPPAPARAAPPRERQVATVTTPPPENRAYSPPITYQPPAAEPTPAAPAFTAPPTVIAPAPQPAVVTPTPAPASPPAPVETNYPVVVWQQQPTVQNRADAYPPTALSRGVGGQATLDCEILPSTRLNCTVQSESPANMGFGRAALQLAPRFKALPVAADGRPVVGKRVKIPVRFQSAGKTF